MFAEEKGPWTDLACQVRLDGYVGICLIGPVGRINMPLQGGRDKHGPPFG